MQCNISSFCRLTLGRTSLQWGLLGLRRRLLHLLLIVPTCRLSGGIPLLVRLLVVRRRYLLLDWSTRHPTPVAVAVAVIVLLTITVIRFNDHEDCISMSGRLTR